MDRDDQGFESESLAYIMALNQRMSTEFFCLEHVLVLECEPKCTRFGNERQSKPPRRLVPHASPMTIPSFPLAFCPAMMCPNSRS